ncbi:MAG: M42 family metallopeptidase [Bacillota bacterium]
MNPINAIKQHLLPLLELTGVSGREAPVIRYMQDALSPLCDELTTDPMGNVFAVKRGNKTGPKLLVTAHSDEIGLLVRSIEPNGFIRFIKVGGTQDSLLPARVVNVAGNIGVIGVKAGHLASEKERNEVKKPADLYIDVGATSKEEAESMGIGIGSPITFVSEPRFIKGNLIVSRALDDRVGCAVLIALMEALRDGDFPGQFHAVVTVQEEVGLRGARVAGFRVNPDLAVALDTIPSGDTPDTNFNKEHPVAIGKGPVLQVTSGGMFADTTVLSLLKDAAEAAGVPYQLVTFTGGNTDSTAIHQVRAGIPSGAVTIPRRYSHSPVELLDLNDAVAALKLLESLARRMPESIQWRLPGEI